jgi:hypothetical protein
MFPSLLNTLLKVTGLFLLPWPQFLGREHMSRWKRDSERDVDVVTGCYMLVRREAMEKVGLLDESFFFCGEETDWCRRFSDAGWRIRFSPVGEIIHLGNASGKSLSSDRDVLLTAGLISYHRKHSGNLAALSVWILLLVFSLTRFVFWAATMPITGRAGSQRVAHYGRVLRKFPSTWPGIR